MNNFSLLSQHTDILVTVFKQNIYSFQLKLWYNMCLSNLIGCSLYYLAYESLNIVTMLFAQFVPYGSFAKTNVQGNISLSLCILTLHTQTHVQKSTYSGFEPLS